MAINLEKGQRISLEKDGTALKIIEVGVNWGMIEKKGMFSSKKVAVDLDASVGLYDKDGKIVDKVYYGHKKSNCGSIVHSGDDLTGDADGDDGEDNEVITIKLESLPSNVEHVALVLNSFRGQDFATIPFANMRIRDAQSNQALAQFDIANDALFQGSVSMIMGGLYRHSGAWKFRSIGEPTKDRGLDETLISYARTYMS